MGYKAQRQRSTAKSSTTIAAAATTKSQTVGDHRTNKFAQPSGVPPPAPCIINDGRPGVGGTAAAAASADRHCAGCHKPITERYLLKAQDQFWHEDCLRCGCCDCRLGEVGATMYLRANLILCKRDYLRLFGGTGCCAACSEVIPAFEMVMRAKSNVYHLNCFACQQCRHRFCVGDRFYLSDNQILCEFDYEQRLVLSKMGPMRTSDYFQEPPRHHLTGMSMNTFNHNHSLPSTSQRSHFPALDTSNGADESIRGDDASSGYGSPVSDTSEQQRV